MSPLGQLIQVMLGGFTVGGCAASVTLYLVWTLVMADGWVTANKLLRLAPKECEDNDTVFGYVGMKRPMLARWMSCMYCMTLWFVPLLSAAFTALLYGFFPGQWWLLACVYIIGVSLGLGITTAGLVNWERDDTDEAPPRTASQIVGETLAKNSDAARWEAMAYDIRQAEKSRVAPNTQSVESRLTAGGGKAVDMIDLVDDVPASTARPAQLADPPKAMSTPKMTLAHAQAVIWPFGKHKGQKLDIDWKYANWYCRQTNTKQYLLDAIYTLRFHDRSNKDPKSIA